MTSRLQEAAQLCTEEGRKHISIIRMKANIGGPKYSRGLLITVMVKSVLGTLDTTVDWKRASLAYRSIRDGV